VFQHRQSVNAADWREWCDSEDFAGPLTARLTELGLKQDEADQLLNEARADPEWFGCAALDAAARLCGSLTASAGLARGSEAHRVVSALFRDTTASGHHIFAVIPPDYWSAIPDGSNTDFTREMLVIRGGVMLRTAGHDEVAALATVGQVRLDAALLVDLDIGLADRVAALLHR